MLQKEEFAHTAYATNAYVALGTGWRGLLQGDSFVSTCCDDDLAIFFSHT